MLRYGYLVVGLGGVGWGNDVHVNLHTHVMLRYCYVLLHLHTHVMLRYGDLLLHLLTHVMLRYGDLLLHLLTHVMLRYGGLLLHLLTHVMLRYGDLLLHLLTTSCYAMVIFSCTCTHTHTSCYVMVVLGGVGVGQWRSCQLAHTRHATLLLCSLALAHTRHATLWLSWRGVGWGWVGQWRLYHGVNTKEHLNWKSESWVTVGENLWDHWHLTDFSKNFARPSKQWSASEKKEKSAASQKTRTYVKNEVVLEIFKTLFFTSTWEKMTFRCSENDIFVDEKLLKPYGRLWVGNQVVGFSRIPTPSWVSVPVPNSQNEVLNTGTMEK